MENCENGRRRVSFNSGNSLQGRSVDVYRYPRRNEEREEVVVSFYTTRTVDYDQTEVGVEVRKGGGRNEMVNKSESESKFKVTRQG